MRIVFNDGRAVMSSLTAMATSSFTCTLTVEWHSGDVTGVKQAECERTRHTQPLDVLTPVEGLHDGHGTNCGELGAWKGCDRYGA